MPQICFLHGFLGCKEDWDGVIAELANYDCAALDYPFAIPKNCVIVGYSMGGRIALDCDNPKIVIGANPFPEDRQWIVDKIKSRPFPQFLQEWYDMPLFETLKNHPDFPQIFARRLKVDPAIALQQLGENAGRLADALFLCGEKDLKYRDLYTQLSLTPKLIPRSGHACHLENPRATAGAIRGFMETRGNFHRHRVPQVERNR